MAISYDLYRVFYAVAQAGSFTHGAQALQSNQPNVTRAIQNLEQELGCRLFQRSNRGVLLTAEGERLFHHVQAAQAHLEAGERELASGRMLREGLVTIGVTETALYTLLLPVLRRFHQAYPGVRLRITNHTTPSALEALRTGAVELALVSSPTHLEQLQAEELTTFRDIILGAQSFAPLARKPLTPAELLREPLVCLGQETQAYDLYRDFFADRGLVYAPDIQVAAVGQILPLVQGGLGLGFLLEQLARPSLASGSVVEIRLTEPLPERNVCLVTNPARPPEPAAGILCQMLRETRKGGEGAVRGDLTRGPIAPALLRFAWPFMVGNLLQQCYNIADTLIVGRYLGSDALGAVGSSYTLMTFLTSILLGLSNGQRRVLLHLLGPGAAGSGCAGASSSPSASSPW